MLQLIGMKWVYRFFVVLGVIFFLILSGIAYLVIADPFNIKPFLSSMSEINANNSNNYSNGSIETSTTTRTSEVNNDGISEGQAEALRTVGINPNSVPNQFTPEQTTCFVSVLGQERVDAIIAGATPTPVEFYQAKDCL